jgi:hypothetical protein
MRARDVRAIGFCTVTIVGLLLLLSAATHRLVVAAPLTLAYAAFVLTRPRMIRVFRRLRGEPDWSGYFDNGGRPGRGSGRPSRGPAAPPANPRPAGRR